MKYARAAIHLTFIFRRGGGGGQFGQGKREGDLVWVVFELQTYTERERYLGTVWQVK